MQDNLISLSCPNCDNCLLEAALLNPMFLHKADCPFCGQPTRWSRIPVTLMASGALMICGFIVSLAVKIKLPYEELPAICLGLGSGSFIIGLLFLRFVTIPKPREPKESLDTYFGQMYSK